MIALLAVATGQSVLLFDALRTLVPLAQDTQLVIVANASAPIAAQFAGLGMAAQYDGAHVVRTSGGGQAAAYNRGILHVLANLPTIEALGFIDEDTVLQPWSLRRMHEMLGRHQDADWLYADPGGAFSPLVQSLTDLGRAGCLVRRRMFAAGLRFAEDLPEAIVRWDFHLAAIARGFRGRRVEHFGMGSRAPVPARIALPVTLQERHPWTCDLRWAVAAEAEAAPRFAIYLPDLGLVRLTSLTDTSGEHLGWDAYVQRFWAAARAPKAYHAGAIFLVTSSLNLQILAAAGVLAWTLFDVEARLRGSDIATVSLHRNTDHRLSTAAPVIGADQAAVLAALSGETLRSVAQADTDAWIRSADSAQPAARISSRPLHLSQRSPYVAPLGTMVGELVERCLAIRRSPFADPTGLPPQDDALGSPDLAQIHRMLRTRFGGGILPPATDRPEPEIAFLLPCLDAEGGTPVLFIAASLRRRGYVVSLVLLNSLTLPLATACEAAFDRIFFIDVQAELPDALNLLSMFGAVLAAGAPQAMKLMEQLRRRGVVTGAYVRGFAMSETGRRQGDAQSALAHHAALDMLITASRDFSLRLHARGVALTKLVMVPDAADGAITAEAARSCRAEREARGADRLHVLLVGPADADDLRTIATRLAARDAVDLRSVTATDSEAFAWADILLLPFGPAGFPVPLLEAMRCGVVPIAASGEDLEGLDELIRDTQDGFIVGQRRRVAETLERVAWLNDDRALLRSMAAAAASASRSWDDAVGDLDDAIRRRLSTATIRPAGA